MGSFTDYLKEVHSDGGRKRMPLILLLGELLLFVMVVRNIINFTVLVMPQEPTFKVVLSNLFSTGFCAVTTIMAVNGMMGMSSARPGCWRKVVRSAFSLLFLAVYYNVLGQIGYVPRGIILDNWEFLIMAAVVGIIMFLPKVRRYYTPPMYPMPPMAEWLRYSINKPIFAANCYRMDFSDGDNGSSDDEVSF